MNIYTLEPKASTTINEEALDGLHSPLYMLKKKKNYSLHDNNNVDT